MLERPVWSLRRRLILISAFAMSLALAVGGVAMYWAATIEADQIVDARLEHLGATVLSLVENGLVDRTTLDSTVIPIKTRPAATMLYRFQVWSRDGVLLLRSHEAPADHPLVDVKHRGFETVRIGGEDYRAFSLPTRAGGVVQLAECLNESSMHVGSVTAYYMAFLLIPFGLVFAVTWLLTRRSLKSLESLALELRHRNPLNASHLDIESPPRELLPIVSALDRLFSRMRQAISVERRFISVAAHEMRTPLAVLRAQAQIATTAGNEQESNAALHAIMYGVDRAAHMLDQLLDMARIETMSEDAKLTFQAVSFANVFRNAMHDLDHKAAIKSITVSVHFGAKELHCLRVGLDLVMRNLLGNAILYCPAGRRVEVRSHVDGSNVVLTVDDAGPGIDPANRHHAFERFNRLGQSKVDGVGLGLSIVLRIVEIHGGKIQLLDAPIGGLRVEISFPQPRLLAPVPTPAKRVAA